MGTRTPRKYLVAATPILLLLLLVGGMRVLTGATSPVGAGLPPLDDKDFLLVRPPAMKRANPQIRHALIAQATDQIKALRAGDYDKALEYTAPDARGAWTGAEFERIFKEWYPGLLKPGKMTFGMAGVRDRRADLKTRANLEIIRTDAAGEESGFLYSFIAEQGNWYVENCTSTGLRGFARLSDRIRRDPTDHSAWSDRAAYYLVRKDYAAAAHDLGVMAKLETGPSNIYAHSRYALALKKSGDQVGYRRERDRIVERGLRAPISDEPRVASEADTERYFAVRFLTADAMSDPACARLLETMIEPLTKATSVRPDGSNQEILGLALCGAGQYKQAIAVLTAEGRSHPGQAQAALALAYARTGDIEKARKTRLGVGPEADFSNDMLVSPLAMEADKALGLQPGQILPTPDPLPRPVDHLKSWRLDVDPGMSASPLVQEPDGALRVTVRSQSTSAGSVRLTYPDVVLVPGRRYSVAFRVRADQLHPFIYRLHAKLDPSDYVATLVPEKASTDQGKADSRWKTLHGEFMANNRASVGEDALTFYVGQAMGNIWFRDIVVKPLPVLPGQPVGAAGLPAFTASPSGGRGGSFGIPRM